MCFCPTVALKIGLLILIPITAGCNAAQIAKDVTLLNVLEGAHRTALIVSLSMSAVILLALIILLYATICTKVRILYAMLIFFAVNCTARLVLIFVCISIEVNPKHTAAHPWLTVSWFVSFFCLASIVLYWIRLHELAQEANWES
ncbi:uncharacterized protein LOC108028088 isoform X1 [Drosophila biarmipes]|uniref:uncharacterized protein LOC108028088 isoform X1 n=1 Tax=Drosophila biarmipes TaxID=125945 RepID=UPI0007E731AF|nr:uncharacterized protein LOC108028088 isoform X1 [Drosophila biarmipes]